MSFLLNKAKDVKLKAGHYQRDTHPLVITRGIPTHWSLPEGLPTHWSFPQGNTPIGHYQRETHPLVIPHPGKEEGTWNTVYNLD